MANPFTGGAASFSGIDYLAPEVAQQQREILRQQAIADLLRQKSLEDDNQTQVVSGWAIPNSGVKRFSQLGQALMAGYMQRKIDDKQAAIAQQLADKFNGVSYAPASQSGSATDTLAQPGSATTAPIYEGAVSASNYDSRKAVAPGATGGAAGPSFQTAMMLAAMGLPVPPKLVEQLSGVQPNKEIVKLDTGDGVKVIAVDPITGAQTLVSEVSKSASPDAQLSARVSIRGQDSTADTARRGQDIGSADQQRGQNLTARTAMRGQDLDYNAKTAAQMAELLRNTPEAKAAVAAAEASAKGAVEQKQKREGAAAGVNNVITQAEGLLKGVDLTQPIVNGKASEVPLPTNSGIGAGLDWLGSLGGISTGGAETADQLKVLGSRLVLSMPRMEGPQSDADRRLYTDMAGQVGDPTIPIARRLKALESVRQIVGKYDTSAPPNSAGGTSWDYVPGKGMVPRQ